MSVRTCEECTHAVDGGFPPPPLPRECRMCTATATPANPRPRWSPRGAVGEAFIACVRHQDELRAEIAALRAENAALRAAIEWMRDDGVNVSPNYVYLNGLQPRAEFYDNLAAAAGHPALAQLGAEGAETTNDTNGSE